MHPCFQVFWDLIPDLTGTAKKPLRGTTLALRDTILALRGTTLPLILVPKAAPGTTLPLILVPKAAPGYHFAAHLGAKSRSGFTTGIDRNRTGIYIQLDVNSYTISVNSWTIPGN